jgi:hypothetical protein
MPKLFSISIEVEEVAVGRVMRLLHNTEGVAKIDMSMGDAKPKTNGSGKPHGSAGKTQNRYEMPNKDFLIKLLEKGTPLSMGHLQKAFKENGRSEKSVNSLAHLIKHEGLIENKGEGYVLSKKMKDRLRHQNTRKAAKHG